jgi:hypothetical protein
LDPNLVNWRIRNGCGCTAHQRSRRVRRQGSCPWSGVRRRVSSRPRAPCPAWAVPCPTRSLWSCEGGSVRRRTRCPRARRPIATPTASWRVVLQCLLLKGFCQCSVPQRGGAAAPDRRGAGLHRGLTAAHRAGRVPASGLRCPLGRGGARSYGRPGVDAGLEELTRLLGVPPHRGRRPATQEAWAMAQVFRHAVERAAAAGRWSTFLWPTRR